VITTGVITCPKCEGSGPINVHAIQKKLFVWHTGFWGESGTNGWSYETMLVVMNLVILTYHGWWEPISDEVVRLFPVGVFAKLSVSSLVSSASIKLALDLASCLYLQRESEYPLRGDTKKSRGGVMDDY
jgi:hypothetical protein